MEGFAKDNTSLGNLYPKSEKELTAIVHLPGPETGNEFQGKSVEVNWIFTAEQRCQPEEPEVPEEPEIPEVPELPDVPGDLKIPDDEDEEIVEIIEDPIPVANIEAEPNIPASSPKLPRTGAAPGVLYYAIGSLLLAIGIKMNKEEE